MFTGLVQHTGTVHTRSQTDSGERLVINPAGWPHLPQPDDSISVSGVCLTVAQPPHALEGMFAFDVIPETLAKTTLGRLEPGHRVNLEHAARLDTLLGGHLVQGHIDGLGDVIDLEQDEQWRVRIQPADPSLMQFVTPKGSITIEGVSLTIAALHVAKAWFEVALIPTTLERTTLGELRIGSAVNLEADTVAKTIVHWAQHYRNQGN